MLPTEVTFTCECTMSLGGTFSFFPAWLSHQMRSRSGHLSSIRCHMLRKFFDTWSLGQGAVHQYQQMNLLCWLVSAPAANESSCCCNLAKVGQGTVMIPEVPNWFVTVVITCNL